MEIPELLKNELVNYCFKHATSKSSVIGNLAKAAHKLARPPEWMHEPVFGGSTWIELQVHERKYYIRLAFNELLEGGRLVTESFTTLLGQKQVRYKAGSVLDRFATILTKKQI
jgi:hypothetical protein